MNNDFSGYKKRDYKQLRKDYENLRRITAEDLSITPEQLNDPVFGEYYRQYADTIKALRERENALLRNAAIAQDTAIANAEETARNLYEQAEKKSGELRQGREELEAMARQRARAMGGMPGSAYEEIQARSERELLKSLASLAEDYNNKIADLEKGLMNRINALESELMDKLAQIEADKTLTLRERDRAINRLKLEMARRAEEEARAARARAEAIRQAAAERAWLENYLQQQQQPQQQQLSAGGAAGQASPSTQPQGEQYQVIVPTGYGENRSSRNRDEEMRKEEPFWESWWREIAKFINDFPQNLASWFGAYGRG